MVNPTAAESPASDNVGPLPRPAEARGFGGAAFFGHTERAAMTLLSAVVATTIAAQAATDPVTFVRLLTVQPTQWSCSSSPTQRSYTFDSGEVKWPCDGSMLLACDGERHEPVDVRRTGCERVVTATTEIARRVRITFPVPTDKAVLEWRGIGSGKRIASITRASSGRYSRQRRRPVAPHRRKRQLSSSRMRQFLPAAWATCR